MRFVQISDLHIGGLFKQDAFDIMVNEINDDLKPDVIIISGDLTDDGLIFQFEQAQNEIKKLKCNNLIIFPGNHDYRHTGYLLFKKFFPIAGSDGPKVYEYKNEGNNYQTVVLTTIGTAIPDRDEGEVGHRQNLLLNNILKKYDNNYQHNNDNRQIYKIVAMHHHLIAIPDTGYTNVVGISDAGDVLRTCLKNNVDLVICGHKHRPWLWNLGTMKIAYAGTACSWRYRGVFEDTYNIIDIREDNKIDIDIKIVGGNRIPLSEVVNTYEPEDRNME
ncbi:MAG TPA: metallophosphoesterase family protein [Candidatus Sulfopaludibacter sp.]|jgi:3',5'-cyclic-AMP phosphodiesterase|nr:metallophosphoesterase family protein [Candidatus Sulfopaludibacter sp.]